MPIPTYIQGYPPDGSSLGQTKATIRNNLDGTFQTLGVDHVNNNGQPNSNPAGYHTVIHMVPKGSNPSTVTGYGQLYSKTVNSVISDTALFWKTGTGLTTQLTSNIVPVAAANGYSFLPGGIIMQWGTVSSRAANGVSPFNINFPNNVFSVQLTMNINADTGSSAAIYWLPGAGLSSFQWCQIITTSKQTGFTWIALGN